MRKRIEKPEMLYNELLDKSSIDLFKITRGSNKRTQWTCKKGHVWTTSVKERCNGAGCPYCSGNAVCIENSLQHTFPNIAREWHPDNVKSPADFTKFSGAKVLWKCEKGHQYFAKINDRTFNKSGCPYCTNKKTCIENCLAQTNSNLLSEWNYIKNIDVSPLDVVAGSHKKVWWVCKKCQFEWVAQIKSRKHRGCPNCHGKIVNASNCLKTIIPH